MEGQHAHVCLNCILRELADGCINTFFIVRMRCVPLTAGVACMCRPLRKQLLQASFTGDAQQAVQVAHQILSLYTRQYALAAQCMLFGRCWCCSWRITIPGFDGKGTCACKATRWHSIPVDVLVSLHDKALACTERPAFFMSSVHGCVRAHLSQHADAHVEPLRQLVFASFLLTLRNVCTHPAAACAAAAACIGEAYYGGLQLGVVNGPPACWQQEHMGSCT
jgi:hypothetical protein